MKQKKAERPEGVRAENTTSHFGGVVFPSPPFGWCCLAPSFFGWCCFSPLLLGSPFSSTTYPFQPPPRVTVVRHSPSLLLLLLLLGWWLLPLLSLPPLSAVVRLHSVVVCPRSPQAAIHTPIAGSLTSTPSANSSSSPSPPAVAPPRLRRRPSSPGGSPPAPPVAVPPLLPAWLRLASRIPFSGGSPPSLLVGRVSTSLSPFPSVVVHLPVHLVEDCSFIDFKRFVCLFLFKFTRSFHVHKNTTEKQSTHTFQKKIVLKRSETSKATPFIKCF